MERFGREPLVGETVGRAGDVLREDANRREARRAVDDQRDRAAGEGGCRNHITRQRDVAALAELADPLRRWFVSLLRVRHAAVFSNRCAAANALLLLEL